MLKSINPEDIKFLVEQKQNADNYGKIIRSWKLNSIQTQVLQVIMEDIYMDGWTDGVAHRTNLTPKEHKERLLVDIEDSWMKLIDIQGDREA